MGAKLPKAGGAERPLPGLPDGQGYDRDGS